MRTLTFLPLVAAIALVGCDQQPTTDKIVLTPPVPTPTNQVEKVEHFTITSKGTFNAGYDKTVREIFILKDNVTGAEYLGITDCTLIRRVKTKKDDAADTAADAVSDIFDAFTE